MPVGRLKFLEPRTYDVVRQCRDAGHRVAVAARRAEGRAANCPLIHKPDRPRLRLILNPHGDRFDAESLYQFWEASLGNLKIYLDTGEPS